MELATIGKLATALLAFSLSTHSSSLKIEQGSTGQISKDFSALVDNQSAHGGRHVSALRQQGTDEPLMTEKTPTNCSCKTCHWYSAVSFNKIDEETMEKIKNESGCKGCKCTGPNAIVAERALAEIGILG